MAKYTIEVVRGDGSGTLNFSSDGVNVSTTCWWDSKMVIVEGSYMAAATFMSNKTNSKGTKREGIWLGKGVKYNGGANTGNGAFIHMGTSPSWSEGCIVCKEADLLLIWNVITPKEQMNIEVIVKDAKKTASPRRAADDDCTSHRYTAGLYTSWL